MPEGLELNFKLTIGEILIAAGALVTLIFSFFHFIGDVSAWGSGFLPVATIIVVFCVVMGLQVVLSKVANLDLGPGIAGFSWVQVHLALGFFAVIDSLAFLVVKKGGAGVGVGLVFILIGSVACLVGAILLRNERGSAA